MRRRQPAASRHRRAGGLPELLPAGGGSARGPPQRRGRGRPRARPGRLRPPPRRRLSGPRHGRSRHLLAAHRRRPRRLRLLGAEPLPLVGAGRRADADQFDPGGGARRAVRRRLRGRLAGLLAGQRQRQPLSLGGRRERPGGPRGRWRRRLRDRLERRLGRLLLQGGPPLALRGREQRGPDAGRRGPRCPRRLCGWLDRLLPGRRWAATVERRLDHHRRPGRGRRRPEHVSADDRPRPRQRRRHEAALRLERIAHGVRQPRQKHRSAGFPGLPLRRDGGQTHLRLLPPAGQTADRALDDPRSGRQRHGSRLDLLLQAPGAVSERTSGLLRLRRLARHHRREQQTGDRRGDPRRLRVGGPGRGDLRHSRRLRRHHLQRPFDRGRQLRRRIRRRSRRLLPHRGRARRGRQRRHRPLRRPHRRRLPGAAAADSLRRRRLSAAADRAARPQPRDPAGGARQPAGHLPQVLPQGLRQAQRALRQEGPEIAPPPPERQTRRSRR